MKANALILCVVAISASARAQTVPEWRVVEDLRIGSDAGPASFTDIRGIGATKAGNIFVLDFKAQEIRMFNARGEFVRVAARRGHGPGEITNSNGFFVAPDDRIWVNDPANARFSIFTGDGKFERQFVLPSWGFSYLWGGIVDAKGTMVETLPLPKPGTRNLVVHYRRVSASKIDTLAQPPCYEHFKAEPPFTGRSANGSSTYIGVPFQPRLTYILDARGTQWCTSSDEYVIYNSSLDTGDTIAVVRSKAPRPPVTSAERASEIARLDSILSRYETKEADYARIPSVKPAISSIFTDPTGRLWVQRTPPATGPSEFDIWDTSGRQTATAKLNFRAQTVVRPVIVGTYLYAIVLDDDDVQHVVRGKITPK